MCDGNVGLTVEQTATNKARVPGKDLRTRPVAAQVGEGKIFKGHHNGGTSLRRVVLFFLDPFMCASGYRIQNPM